MYVLDMHNIFCNLFKLISLWNTLKMGKLIVLILLKYYDRSVSNNAFFNQIVGEGFFIGKSWVWKDISRSPPQ